MTGLPGLGTLDCERGYEIMGLLEDLQDKIARLERERDVLQHQIRMLAVAMGVKVPYVWSSPGVNEPLLNYMELDLAARDDGLHRKDEAPPLKPAPKIAPVDPTSKELTPADLDGLDLEELT